MAVTVGEQLGLSVNYISGTFTGNVKNATFESLMSNGNDVSGSFGEISAGPWTSFDGSALNPTWVGTSVGGAPGCGFSTGLSSSTEIK